MKAILISIRPQHVANIFNLIKLLEIRKKFPKDYVGWVYIYVTKALPLLLKNKDSGKIFINKLKAVEKDNLDRLPHIQKFNGKVVARFWCDKVEEIKPLKHKPSVFCPYNWLYYIVNDSPDNLKKNSCLDFNELHTYLQGKNGYAIHITKVEPFDKSKEISEFHKIDNSNGFICFKCPHLCTDDSAGYSIDSCDLGFENCEKTRLTRAPQSWCWIEV